jgi:hypothetical protein
MIRKGIPSVILVTERFTALAKAVRTGRGMPDLPSLFMPLNPQFYPDGEVERVTEQLIDDYVDLIAPGMRQRAQRTAPATSGAVR